jgi:aerobic C4-dicarboxylate transport protein
MSQPERKRWYSILYVQVLLAVAIGIYVGHQWPEFGIKMRPFGDAFIKVIKMIIAPIIFCSMVHGIASMSDMRRLGRVGGKTILYFEIVSTLALILGLVVVNVLKPGAGFNFDVTKVDPLDNAKYTQQAHSLGFVDFLVNVIPKTYLDAFVTGDLLQVIFVSILTAFAISALGPARVPVLHAIEQAGQVFFGIIRIVVRAAPVGAFGAMAFTIGSYGLASLTKLVNLMLAFYLTATVFVVVVLGLIAWWAGFSVFRYLYYIREELLLVLGTSSSETALPGLMKKMRRLGCADSTVGLVIPTGYSFNLDGTNIYMTMAALFLAQATNTHLTLTQQLSLLLVAMVSSKGASGVTGAGFVALAATLSAVPTIPIGSLAILLGIDRFMSECRALTNLVGNGLATLVISRSENEMSAEELRANLKIEHPT